DLATQILLAQLPLLASEDPESILVIGLGTGVTVTSALTYPDTTVDCVEIDDAVIEASTLFSHVWAVPMDTSRSRIIKADARTVLTASKKHYDVIISEPSNPWITGVSNLFTYEHFTACHDALRSDGIMCQWVHSYYMDTDTLLVLFRTFSSVFEFCSLWEGSRGDYLILGSNSFIQLDQAEIRRKLSNENIRRDLERIGLSNPSSILAKNVQSNKEFKNMVEKTGTVINLDDEPYVEFNAPKSLYHMTVQSNRELIESYKMPDTTIRELSLSRHEDPFP
ncbi:fused MFS/spermidine synthase, partial [bacterium]|nr:fused MFS/spermidine synthase [candidate division CSSED10-310 bacterium]